MRLAKLTLSILTVALSMFVDATSALSLTTLRGQLGNYTAYFTEAKRVRHHRYSLDLQTKSTFADQVWSVTGDFRAWYDAALADRPWAAQRDIDPAVRRDEMTEASIRQLYVSYSGSSMSAKAGWMQLDWMDALAPGLNNFLTPMDLRFGAFGTARELVRPVGAVDVSHYFDAGTLNWVAVMAPAGHRLPVADNGYGYFSYLNRELGGMAYGLSREDIDRKPKNWEYGARYLTNVGDYEMRLLAYRGHQRFPVLDITYEDPRLNIVEVHPQVDTYGASLNYAAMEWVARAMVYHQPKAADAVWFGFADESDEVREVWAERTQIGAGYDYVFSKHLKLYSESFFLYTHRAEERHPILRELGDEPRTRQDYTVAVKLTNETYDDTLFELDYVWTAPEHSFLLEPSVTYTLNEKYRAALGGRYINTRTLRAPLAILKDSSHVYLSLEYLFSATPSL